MNQIRIRKKYSCFVRKLRSDKTDEWFSSVCCCSNKSNACLSLHNMSVHISEIHLPTLRQRGGYDSCSITSLCKSMVDCFAADKNVVGSIPTGAPKKSSAQSFSLLFQMWDVYLFERTNPFFGKKVEYYCFKTNFI